MAVVLAVLLLIIRSLYAETIECVKNENCSCSSSITDTTCTLNCDGEDQCKDRTLTCRSGDFCIILCNGPSACGGNTIINGSDATDVSITCSGKDSCKGNTKITCGSGACNIECDGSTSCQDTTIDTSNASSFECTNDCPSGNDWDSFTSSPSPTTSPPTVAFVVPPALPLNPSPTVSPSVSPSDSPSVEPTSAPTSKPTPFPTDTPSLEPSVSPSNSPSVEPTNAPSPKPTLEPTTDNDCGEGCDLPTDSPTSEPTTEPTIEPTMSPSSEPTPLSPSTEPTMSPSMEPTLEPTVLDPLTVKVTDSQSQGVVEDDIQSTAPFINGSPETGDVLYGMSVGDILMLTVGMAAVFCLCAIGLYARRRSKSKRKQWTHCTTTEQSEPRHTVSSIHLNIADQRRVTETDAVSSDSESDGVLDRQSTTGLVIDEVDDSEAKVHHNYGGVGNDKVDGVQAVSGVARLHQFGAGLSAQRIRLSNLKKQSTGSSVFGDPDPEVRGSDASLLLPAYKQTAGMIQAFMGNQESGAQSKSLMTKKRKSVDMNMEEEEEEEEGQEVLAIVVESSEREDSDHRHRVETQGFIGEALDDHREDVV